jgi:hypothetical protein
MDNKPEPEPKAVKISFLLEFSKVYNALKIKRKILIIQNHPVIHEIP